MPEQGDQEFGIVKILSSVDVFYLGPALFSVGR